MKSYFQLIRWKNLLFLLINQLLIQFAVVYPILQTFGFETGIYNHFYLLLNLSTLLITAGGYVINDYFDLKIDRINKPEKVIINSTISTHAAMIYYQVLTVAGTILGILLSILSHSFTLGLIYIVTVGLLWFYSASYKRQFIVGNLIVALTSSLSILITGILAISLLKAEYGSNLLNQTPIPSHIYGWTGGFAGFAFLLTWIREIIKDMEDLEGDRQLECRTMPIKWGIDKTKYFLYVLILFTIGALYFLNQSYISFDGNLTIRYITVGIVLPLVILGIETGLAKKKEDFHQASTLAKFTMLMGVIYSLIFSYLTAKANGISLFGLFIVK